MSKFARTAVLVVGAVALAATGIGAVAGAGMLLAGGLTAGTVATVASAAASALTIGAGFMASKPSGRASGSQVTFTADPDDGLPIIIGRGCTPGAVAWRLH